jgi:hypothetical protein
MKSVDLKNKEMKPYLARLKAGSVPVPLRFDPYTNAPVPKPAPALADIPRGRVHNFCAKVFGKLGVN